MTISVLGDDLLTEILIRSFPNPRYACRSRTVCKRWKSLISDPRFSRRFLSHHQTTNRYPRPKLLLSGDRESVLLRFLPMPLDDIGSRPRHFAVFDCFKDLLLCGFGETGDRHTNAELARSYLLCNPFSKQWVALPLAPERPEGHTGLYARLVCEPLVSDSLDLGSGFEYRFRVVCIYQDVDSMKLDVFCSESGEWTKEALVLEGYRRREINDVVTCNGVLYVSYVRARDEDSGLYKPFIAGFNPFRLDMPPTPVDVSLISANRWWDISVSQGALHLIVFEKGTRFGSSRIFLSVWRLNEDCKFWRKVCEGPVKSSSGGTNYPLKFIHVPTLHPEKPETVFFAHLAGLGNSHVFCDLRKGGKLKFVAKLTQYSSAWRVFKPKVSCWPTPIPRYQKLRVGYDGSYSCWVQSDEPRTEEWQRVDGVEQSCHWKKLKRW